MLDAQAARECTQKILDDHGISAAHSKDIGEALEGEEKQAGN